MAKTKKNPLLNKSWDYERYKILQDEIHFLENQMVATLNKIRELRSDRLKYGKSINEKKNKVRVLMGQDKINYSEV